LNLVFLINLFGDINVARIFINRAKLLKQKPMEIVNLGQRCTLPNSSEEKKEPIKSCSADSFAADMSTDVVLL
jgi:hypothetical protein